MDSKLLSAMHDDPFDGNFWPNTTNESLGIQQLAETLHGILPIPATAAVSMEGTSEFKDDAFHKNVGIYNTDTSIYDFVEEHLIPQGEEIEIVAIDHDSNRYGNKSDDDDCDVVSDVNATYYVNKINDDLLEGYSNMSETTFRSRTDSSSIADYESHSSDYDDYDYNDNDDSSTINVVSNADQEDDDNLHFEPSILTADDFLLDNTDLNDINLYGGHKRRTISTNTIASDVYDLMPADGRAFDLTEFIIKDDFIANGSVLEKSNAIETTGLLPDRRHRVSESDSDITVDIETVEAVPELDDVPFVDNLKADPPWSPKLANEKTFRKKPADAIQQKKPPAPTPKKQFEPQQKKSNPKKAGVGLNENTLTKQIEANATNGTLPKVEFCEKQASKRKLNIEEYKRRRGVASVSITSAVDASTVTKSLACIKETQNKSQLEASKVGITADVNTASAQVPLKKHSEAVVSIVRSLKEEQESNRRSTTVMDPITEARKKVLRMQELKRAQQLKIIDSTVSAKVPRVTKVLPLKDIIKDTKYSAAISKDDSAKESKSSHNSAAHPDYEEKIVVSVGCNTDISLPSLNLLLNYQRAKTASRSLLKSSVLLRKVEALNSNSLIASIQNTVVMQAIPSTQRQQQSDNPIDLPLNQCSSNLEPQPHGENKIIMHLRKDRMRKIMISIETQTELLPEFPIFPLPVQHRRQYRKRSGTQSSCTTSSSRDSSSNSSSSSASESEDEEQTHRKNTSMSAALGFSSVCTSNAVTDTTGGYSSRSSRRHRSSISSSYSDSEKVPQHNRRQRRSSYKQREQRQNAARSSSTSSSEDYSPRKRNRTRSRSPFRNTSMDHNHDCNYKSSRWSNGQYSQNNNDRMNTNRSVPQPAVEERRIVYVGRLEQHTTKEILRRKFQVYGPINQITMHTKETGMKYGFVTFSRSQDAFSAIDSSARDQRINMYDVSFGGRRAFCRASYADLDNAGINTYHSFVFPKASTPPRDDDSFEALLLKVKAKLSSNKIPTTNEISKPTPAAATDHIPKMSSNDECDVKSTKT